MLMLCDDSKSKCIPLGVDTVISSDDTLQRVWDGVGDKEPLLLFNHPFVCLCFSLFRLILLPSVSLEFAIDFIESCAEGPIRSSSLSLPMAVWYDRRITDVTRVVYGKRTVILMRGTEVAICITHLLTSCNNFRQTHSSQYLTVSHTDLQYWSHGNNLDQTERSERRCNLFFGKRG